MLDATCSIELCVSPPKTAGLCSAHYQRAWRYGNPLGGSPDLDACRRCGLPNPPKPARGIRPQYCSRLCRDKASYERNRETVLTRAAAARAKVRTSRPCPRCEDEFTPSHGRQKYCSPACARRAHSAARRDRARTTACQIDDCPNKVVARGLCRKHHPTGPAWSKGKPETRRAALRRKTQQRRARTKGDPDAELIDRDEIGDRDRWVCGICARKVDRSLAHPHPRSASLDHIEPLARDGKHTKSNVQIARLDCNIRKSDRGGGEQLLLIG